MGYVILDLEWNIGSFPSEDAAVGNAFFSEILQIGAYFVDVDFNIYGPFDRHVQAEVHDQMNPYVEKVTGLTTDDLQDGSPFPEVWGEFLAWLTEMQEVSHAKFEARGQAPPKGLTLMSWGDSDVPVLLENLRYFNLPEAMPFRVLDLQKLFAQLLEQPKKERPALSRAMQQLEIEKDPELHLHDAATDAYYTAQVLRALAPQLREDYAADPLELQEKIYVLSYIPGFQYKSHRRLPFRVNLSRIAQEADEMQVFCPGCGKPLSKVRPWNRNRRLRWIAGFDCPEHGAVSAVLKIHPVTPKKSPPGFAARMTLQIPKPF